MSNLFIPLCAISGLIAAPAMAAAAEPLTADTINRAVFAPLPDTPGKRPVAEIVRAAVLLDRTRFSPGAIDGLDGDNFREANAAYQAAKGLPVTRRLDQATWDRLVADDPAPAMVMRELSAADVKGPFVAHIPAKFEAQAKLKRMGYTSALEQMSEEVHASPGLLPALNPRAAWSRRGTTVTVPQVVVQRPPAGVTRIVVDKPGHAVDAFAVDGSLVAVYPASIGSEEKPAPTGDFTVRRVIHNPDYTYNPKYAFKGVKATKPFTIAPGPNNPVGSVWLDLSFEGYGIHGTPQPDLVGKTQSHGCIRLTNWAAEDLASMVKPGAAVSFVETSPTLPAGVPAPPASPAPTPASAAAPAPATGSAPVAPAVPTKPAQAIP